MKGNKKIITAAIVWGAALLAFAGFVLVPLFQGVKGDAKELLSLRQEISKLSSLEQEIQRFQQAKENTPSSFLRVENLRIDPEPPIPFIEFLEEAALKGGFVFKIVPGVPKQAKGEPWPVMGFQVSSTGSYPEFLVLLEKLESAPYLLDLENLNVSRSRRQTAQEEPQRVVDFTVLFQVATKDLAKDKEE